VEPVFADLAKEFSVQAAVERAELVVNLVGILYERGRQRFQTVHVDGAARIAAAAKAAGAGTLVHVSALGADPASPSAYARTKAAGEVAVRQAFPQAVIVRPSAVFGPEDGLFNRFARLAAFSPVLPVFVRDGFRFRRDPATGAITFTFFGSGGPKLQPVYVGDVADALVAAAAPTHAGRTFELAGPKVYSLKQLMELAIAASGRRRWLVPVPMIVARIQAAFLQYLPAPPLTPDQVRLLGVDSVASGALPGLADLGIAAQAAEAVVPTYLARTRNRYEQRSAI
jgi:NADH dehydrogenase